MSTRINDGGSAFPSSGSLSINGERRDYNDSGMTLRDWFAGKAITSASMPLQDGSSSSDPAKIARWAYDIADAMIIARETTTKPTL